MMPFIIRRVLPGLYRWSLIHPDLVQRDAGWACSYNSARFKAERRYAEMWR